MSKIICEVCGTSYSDAAAQCPICGCVRPANAPGIVADPEGAVSGAEYAYVKGGRFSKGNVKKRTRAHQAGADTGATPVVRAEKKKKGNWLWILLIPVIFMLLVLIGVVLFISLRYFGPGISMDFDTTSAIVNVDERGPCTALTLTKDNITLEGVGDSWTLNVEIEPRTTTDVVKYSSDNELVATVDSKGNVTAVGPGETTITIKCGTQEVKCKIICDFVPETTEEPVEETTEEMTEETTENLYPDFVLTLNRKDMTMSYYGEKWDLYDGEVPAEMITWTSDNENIVTIEDGVVKAVGVGHTEVHAEFNGQIVTCIVRCSFMGNNMGGSNITPDEG